MFHSRIHKKALRISIPLRERDIHCNRETEIYLDWIALVLRVTCSIVVGIIGIVGTVGDGSWNR